MATVPKQVEQDLRDLEAYEQQLAAEKNPKPAEPQAPEAAAPAPQAPAPAPGEQAAPPQQAPAQPQKPDTPDWEQKYKTLQGMFDSQVPQLHKQNREQATQLQAALARIEALERPAPAAKADEPLVTDKDVTEYGAELIDVQRRVAREVMRDMVAPLQAELKAKDAEILQLKQAQTKTDGTVVALTFDQRLAQAVPDFTQINTDPKWIAFLDETDPYTQEPRRAFAEFAYNTGDVVRLKQVVDFFKSKQTPVVTPDPAEVERQQRQLELERQITPTRANSQPVQNPANVLIYTEKEMEDGFATVRKLNAANKYEEAAKLEAELSLAYMQGRVRG